jgi:hypothetical protein
MVDLIRKVGASVLGDFILDVKCSTTLKRLEINGIVS